MSDDEKAELARRAGAHQIINYRQEKLVPAVLDRHPSGADIIVEVNLSANIEADLDLVASNGTIAN
ncbi:zinc-binding dehydrogenase [Mycobacterium tilburgii]|uniref:zinc-binding dehydrogenase n=1 Tax=Mycobacterium tilburgii TaxID=44467 RepID=UPI0011824023